MLQEAVLGGEREVVGRGRGAPRSTSPGLLQDWLTLHLWDEVLQEGVLVPKKFPPEFKRDVVRVARRGDLSHAEVAADSLLPGVR